MKARIVDGQIVDKQFDSYIENEGEVWVPITNHSLRSNIIDQDWSGRSVGQLINDLYFDLFELKDAGISEFIYEYDAQSNTVIEIMDAAPLLPKKLDQLAKFRKQKEEGGTSFMGVGLDTSAESQAKIIGARLAAMADPNYTVNWKAANGWVTLDSTMITMISDAVRTHIQSCFDQEKFHSEQMSAIKDAFALMAYDYTVGWPS